MSVPRQPGGTFDEHRNTSRVFPVAPGSGGAAVDAMRRWAAANAAHAQWIRDGYPTLTEAQHLAIFGEPYNAKRLRAVPQTETL